MKTQTEIDYLAENEGHAPLYFGVRIDSDLFVTLRSRASNDASDDEGTSAHVGDEWARHAAASSGFGDGVTELAMAGAHLRGSARTHRAGVFGGAFVAAIRAIGASLHHIYAWLRRVHPKERTMSSDDRGDSGRHKLRSRIAIAFQRIAHAVDARTAHRMTRSFYRSSRMPWTAGLN